MIKFIQRYINVYLKYTLVAAVLLLLVVKARKTAATTFDMDNLAEQLKPIKQSIIPGSKIGFVSTYTDPGLFIRVQYILAPQIINALPAHDTLLVISRNGHPGKQSGPDYHIISQSDNNGMVISLISEVK